MMRQLRNKEEALTRNIQTEVEALLRAYARAPQSSLSEFDNSNHDVAEEVNA
jgi:hypothetical protein